jgi:hypothetical protein
MTAAAHFPDPRHHALVDSEGDGVEPAPQWTGDTVAARRFTSPEAIRAALLLEQVAEFDGAYDAALTAARQTRRLDQLRHVLRVWRRVALLTEQNPEGHRQMLATATEVQRSGRPRPGSVPWTDLKSELGL